MEKNEIEEGATATRNARGINTEAYESGAVME